MRNEVVKGLLVVGVDYGYLRTDLRRRVDGLVEAEDDHGDPPVSVRTISPVLCGRNSQDVLIFSYLLPSKGNSERNIAVLSQELMAG